MLRCDFCWGFDKNAPCTCSQENQCHDSNCLYSIYAHKDKIHRSKVRRGDPESGVTRAGDPEPEA